MKNLIKHNRSENYIQHLQDEMDRIMEDTFGSLGLLEVPKENKLWRPPAEMVENEKEYKVKLQLPGFDKKDIRVEVGADYITVKAQNCCKDEEKKKNMYRSEFRYGSFMRTMSFAKDINPNKTHVEYQNGVLSIKAPKMNLKELSETKVKAVSKKAPKAIAKKAPKATIKKAKPKNKVSPKMSKK